MRIKDGETVSSKVVLSLTDCKKVSAAGKERVVGV